MLVLLNRSFAQVWMLGLVLITIFETTIFVPVICVCASFLATRVTTLFAKRYFPFILFVVIGVT